MTIKTKFNIGDTFYRMNDNAVFKDTVDRIVVTNTTIDGIEIKYISTSINEIIYEENMFLSKQALLESL